MKISLALCVISLLIAGCSHSYQVQENPATWYSFESVNKELSGQDVTLLFTNSHVDSGTIVSLAKDTTSYVRRSTTEIQRVQTSSLRLIQVESPGTWDGAGLGALIGGAGTGLLFGVAAGSSPGDFPVGALISMGIGVGGLGGAVVGLIIGSATTRVDTYMLSSEEEE